MFSVMDLNQVDAARVNISKPMSGRRWKIMPMDKTEQHECMLYEGNNNK